MYKAIIVGVDGSATALEALRRAARLAASTGAELHVVCAYQSAALVAVDPIGAAAIGPTSSDALKHAAQDVLDGALKSIPADDVKVEAHAIQGEASDVLIDMAEGLGCDLIVVGSKGMRGGKRLLLGSVPNRVAHHAGRDVLIVHTG
jgi:nucleotide-binding universal stress UspA family protein